ncbi:MAG: ribokinase [Candidatus Omnitrophota bacterium]|jgi:ribokinase|nr:MAG: ribokinase [Candidatus Omnitrophota bacterium]
MNKIIVVGSSNTDMVVRCSRLPKPGETVLGGEFIRAHGGKGANQAVAAARLGGQVSFVCRVGNDSFGQEATEAYKQEGIDTSNIIVDLSGASGIALIVVDEHGENYIAVASGVNLHLCPADVDFLATAFSTGDVLLLQLEIPIATVERAAEIAKEKGAIVILDPAPAPSDGLPDSLFPQLDYILPNEHEAAALIGKNNDLHSLAQALLQKGTRNVIITAGEKGCVLANQNRIETFPAFPVNAADSTAAGDAFAGGLAVALAEGIGLRNAIEFAQKAAALSVTKIGAQPSLPRREEIVDPNSLEASVSFT